MQGVSLALGHRSQFRCDRKQHVFTLVRIYILASLSTLMYLYCTNYFRDKGLNTQAFWIGLFLLNPDEGFAWIDGSPVSIYLLDIN